MSKANEGPSDMNIGKPPKDEQMKALQKAHGAAVRQSTLPPYISKQQMPHDPDETD